MVGKEMARTWSGVWRSCGGGGESCGRTDGSGLGAGASGTDGYAGEKDQRRKWQRRVCIGGFASAPAGPASKTMSGAQRWIRKRMQDDPWLSSLIVI